MRIHAIETGRVRIKQAQIEGRGHGLWRQLQPILSREWADWSPVYAWVIEHPEGVIVVDTGANAGLKSLPRWHPYFQLSVRFDIEPEQELGPQLQRRGISARDVKTVVLTHMHIDHDGYLPNRWPNWFQPEPLVWQPSPFGPFKRSARITKAGDVLAVPTAGHTPGHLSVIVSDGDEQIMLAGDASYLQSTMFNGTVDGVSANEAEAQATLADIRALCARRPTVYLPTHDPKSAERLKDRRAATVSHANFLFAHFRRDAECEELQSALNVE
jgi:glyoxylase-like metal-dependent hydrolase (beta-lactamase superfamily II)